MKKDDRVRIELTEEQKQQIKAAGLKEPDALEFTVQELEQRIAPYLMYK